MPSAEKLGPHSVHDHAAHQWIARIDQPPRQGQAIGRLTRGERMQATGYAGRDQCALDIMAAANQDMRLTGLGELFHHHRRRRLNRVGVPLQLSDLILEWLQLCSGRWPAVA